MGKTDGFTTPGNIAGIDWMGHIYTAIKIVSFVFYLLTFQ